MRAAGAILLTLGMLLIAVAFGMETSVDAYTIGERDIANLSLMQRQSMFLHLGVGAFLAGILLVGFGTVADRVAPAPTIQRDPIEEAEGTEDIERTRKIAVGALLGAFALVVLLLATGF